MKTALIFLLTLAMYFPSQAQRRGKYNIKVVEQNQKKHRGVFYAADNDGLMLISNGDTISVKAEQITALYIKRRGIVGPFAIAAALPFLVAAIATPGVYGIAYFLIGIPLSAAAGFILAQPFANKRSYKNLKAKDFPIIKDDLRKYTVVK